MASKRDGGYRCCVVDGCDRPAHGGSELCRGHKRRRERHQPVATPLRAYERDPNQRVLLALERWHDSYVHRCESLDTYVENLEELKAAVETLQDQFRTRRLRVDDLLRGGSDLAKLRENVKRRAEVEAEDDVAWRRANVALRMSLSRYAKARRKGSRR